MPAIVVAADAGVDGVALAEGMIAAAAVSAPASAKIAPVIEATAREAAAIADRAASARPFRTTPPPPAAAEEEEEDDDDDDDDEAAAAASLRARTLSE